MKTDRQKLILELISGQDVGTQQQLLELLSARGVRCTQATLSRDIHALNLVKLPSPGGGVRYGVEPVPTAGNDASKLLNIARLASLSIEAACNIIVIKTMPGLANGACSALDNMDLPYIVGSLAGDDTAFLLMKDTEAAEAFCEEIKEML